MSRRHYLDTAQPVTLTADVSAVAVSLPVDSSAGFPAVPFTIGISRGTVDMEVCLVTAVPDSTHFTVTRAFDGTTGKIHLTGAPIEHCVIAADYDEANAHVNDSSLHSFPTGALMAYAGAAAPAGWLLCDGSAVSRATYAALHALLRDAGGANTWVYGAGDGSTTFNTPDLRGRMPLGRDNMGGSSANRVVAAAADAMGGVGGAETVTLVSNEMPSHTHVQNAHTHVQNAHTHVQNAHSHNIEAVDTGTGAASGLNRYEVADGAAGVANLIVSATAVNQNATAVNQNTTAVNQNTGGGAAHANMPPFMAILFIIKT